MFINNSRMIHGPCHGPRPLYTTCLSPSSDEPSSVIPPDPLIFCLVVYFLSV